MINAVRHRGSAYLNMINAVRHRGSAYLNMINAVRHRGSATESVLELLSLSFNSGAVVAGLGVAGLGVAASVVKYLPSALASFVVHK